jgi:hypothetical protein
VISEAGEFFSFHKVCLKPREPMLCLFLGPLLLSFGKNHGRTHGCKWNLLKVWEGNYKREHGGTRWKLEAENAHSLFQVLSKLMLTYGKGRTWCFPTDNQ